jgi:hypothetical protein
VRPADPLEDQARRLVDATNILAISTFVPAIDQYPFLKQCNPKDWDFFATVASIQVGIANLIHCVPEERFKLLYPIIAAALHKWNPQGEDAVQDCQAFIRQSLDPKSIATGDIQPIDALGMWVIWNLLRRAPSRDEAQASRAIGRALAAPIEDWWNAK